MCGIAGFAGLGLPREASRERLRAMCDAIQHRGPDSDGYFVSDLVALGIRRLSIIDVAGGTQPISNEDGTVTVVFNGEIYNHRDLRRDLEASGHRFATLSDTEVLVHLYEEHGTRMLSRLSGMFAFAIWDERRQRLFIARDRTGIKPLSYACRRDGIVFCSELRSLYAFDRTALSIAPSSVMQYLAFGYVPDPSSIFDNVNKLPPGHYLTWQPHRGVEVDRYWNPPTPDAALHSEEEVVEEMRLRLDAAVRSHLEAEVPLGAFLSGGVDSSTVVALMCRHASGRVKTFSIGFAEKEYDESPAARAVASYFDTEHVSLIVRPDVEQIFESIAAMFDEPFADSSAIPTFLVAQLARQSVTVALSGDGGDELFGGYTRYRDTLRRGAYPSSAVAGLLSAVGLMLPHAFPGRNRLVDLGRSPIGRYAATVVQPVRTDEGGVAAGGHPLGRVRIDEQLRRHFPAELSRDFAAAMMRADLQTYLPGDILTKVDRTSMAVSLEARVPLLDRDLVEFALRIPGELCVTSAESKRLFRRAIQGLIPDAVLSRPKQGFQVPLARWFKGPLHHRIAALRSPSGALEPYVSRKAVERLVGEHSIGRRDHSAVLWRLMVLDHWLASYRDGRLGLCPSVPSSDWSAADRSPAATVTMTRRPAAVSSLFLRSDASRPPLRIGLLIDGEGVPAYARSIIKDVLACTFAQFALVAVATETQPRRPHHSRGMMLRAYEAYIESRYPSDPDPLEPVDCSDLLAEVPQLKLAVIDAINRRTITPDAVAALSAADLDVLLDFGRLPARGGSLPETKHGVWRYHFGDRTRYPAGSGFFREIVDGEPLSGIELTRLGATAEADSTILRARFSTAPFPSRRCNRFAPIWGSRHFVSQALWGLHQAPEETTCPRDPVAAPNVARVPSNAQLAAWLLRRTARRLSPFRRLGNAPVAWRIALRRTTTPLFEDFSSTALSAFRWLDTPPGHYWADPVIFHTADQAWLFFEEIIGANRIGRIACGRLTDDGRLIDVHPVMQRPYHVSFPQIIQSDGEVFMLPEAAQSGRLDLYRARRFPEDWVLEATLLDFRCVDSSIFRAYDCWWLVTSPQVVPGHAPITWLLRSDRVTGPWAFCDGGEVSHDATVARGSGAVFEWNGRLIRPSQDCSIAYGRALLFNEVLSLAPGPYRERTICRIDADRMPGLAAIHSYSLSGPWEAIDGGFALSEQS